MTLVKLPQTLAIALTVTFTSILAMAQTLLIGFVPHQTLSWIDQNVKVWESQSVDSIAQPLSLNQISGELAQSWINNKTDSQTRLSSDSDLHQAQNTLSGCNCPQCQGIIV